jgi:hypothetical protein
VNGQPKSFLHRLGHWSAELILVFVGVYAAFWFSNYQQHLAAVERHDQILAWLEQRMKEGLENTQEDVQNHDQQAAKFHQELAAGKMPPLEPFSFNSDYSASDMSSLLQSGGYEVLDIKTLKAVHELESTIRWGLDRMTHYQKLSDELIWPNLDQDVSFFYDPATKQLRKKFERYPVVLDDTAKFFHDLEKAKRELLAQIQAERQKR